MKLARHATNMAIARVRTDKRKRALLYNLGRIDEAEGNTEAAIDDYTRSLVVRDNETVKARLESLSGQSAPSAVLKISAIEGLRGCRPVPLSDDVQSAK
jgi:hypothetical protein